ncbi:MAG: hypothetical protein AAGJ31_02190 [Verrucomicrobiota bacterium]
MNTTDGPAAAPTSGSPDLSFEPTVPPPPSPNQSAKSGGNAKIVLGIILAVLVLAILGVVVWIVYNFYAHNRPVNLSEKEMVRVEEKVGALSASSEAAVDPSRTTDDILRERGQARVIEGNESPGEEPIIDRRMIAFTQREINGMLNYNSALGEQLQLQLKPGYIDIQFFQPIPDDVQFFGGQTWRVSLDVSLNKVPGGGMEMALKDLTIGGVPIPSAWLSMIGIEKNQDIIELIKKEVPAFEKFEQGIEYIDISSGTMQIKLAE